MSQPSCPSPGILSSAPLPPASAGAVLGAHPRPRCIWELSAAARAAGTPAEAAALLPQAGIEAPLNSPLLLERSQPWPRASLFPPNVSGALPELGSISSTPRVPSLCGPVPPGLLHPHGGILPRIPKGVAWSSSVGWGPWGHGDHEPAWLFFPLSAPCRFPAGRQGSPPGSRGHPVRG